MAVLYAPDISHMLIQATQHFTVATVQKYFNMVHGSPFLNLQAVIDYSHPERFRVAGGLKSAHFRVQPWNFTSRDYDDGEPLENVTALACGMRDITVEVKIYSTKKGVSLANIYRSTVEKLIGKAPMLKVKVENPDQQTEMLNLVNPLMEAEVPMELDKNRVFPVDKRYEALMHKYHEWKPELQSRSLS